MKMNMLFKMKRCIPGFLLLLLTSTAFGQIDLSGTVTDEEGIALPGVSVSVNGTIIGTVTNIDGKYSLNVENVNSSLRFSFVGFQTMIVPVKGQTVINVSMVVEDAQLGEVVVVGYSSQKKSTLTGAVATINITDMGKRRVADVSQAIQGQMAGVQVTQSTGAPGDDIEIRIRGEGTIGNNSPLFIIDGTPSRDISFLSPSDIKSMTVLKDASSAAIYGSRASSGVVIITTRSGVKGRSSLNINYYNGIQAVTNLPDMLNSAQYMDVVEKAWNNAGYSGTNIYTADKGRADFADTDWLDELFELGHSQNIQLTATGGNEKVQYLLSTSYFNQDGIVKYNHDKFQRINVRTNLNADMNDRLKMGTNLQLSYSIQDKLSSKGDSPGIIRHAMLRPPVLSVYKDVNDPTYSEQDPFTDLPFYKHNDQMNGGWESNKYEWTSNPLALAYFTDDKRSQFKTFGNIYAEYSFLKEKELKFRTNAGVDLNFTHNKNYRTNFGDDDGGGNEEDQGTGRQNRPNGLNEDRGEEITFTWNNTLNYKKQTEKHSINALVGSEFVTNYASSIGASRSRYDYDDDTFRYIDFGSTEKDIWNNGSGSEWSLFSLFGSATYVYNNRYMLTANVRADASSRFSENNRWGYFPSVSAGWKLSEENFLRDVDGLSDLKVRASWGLLGNQEIDNYAYLTLIRKDGDKYITSRYGNPDLKWETTEQYNAGVDLGFLKNRIYVSIDYFVKNTSDILLPIQLPSIAGDVLPTIVNAGEVKNQGIEFAINYRNNEHAFKYSINANVGTVKNEVKKLHPNLPNIVGQVSRIEVGHALNSYYGYQMEGIYQNQAEIDQHLFGAPTSIQPGDIKFKDLDGNGIIDDNDRDYMGNPIPKLTYGLNFTGEYKHFDFSVLLQGVSGVDRYNDSKKIVDYDTRPFNYTTRVLNAWDGEGTSNSIPRVSFTDNGSSKISDIYVEDASYLRLKNIELGYTLNSLFKKSKVGIENIRLYVSAQNLFTITDYTGLDPESTDLIDMGTFPQAQSFLFGVDVKF